MLWMPDRSWLWKMNNLIHTEWSLGSWGQWHKLLSISTEIMATNKRVLKKICTREMHKIQVIYHQTQLLPHLPVFIPSIPNYYKPLLMREKTFNTPSPRYSVRHQLKKLALLQIKNTISEKSSFNSINFLLKSLKIPLNLKISSKSKP